MKIFLILCLVFCAAAFAEEITNETLLPEILTVYYHPEQGISTTAFKEAQAKKVFTNNHYKDIPGCYVLCLSKNKKRAAYEIEPETYLMGQIRVPGSYADGVCVAKDHEEVSIAESTIFKEKCEAAFPERCEKQSCWASPRSAGF